MAGIRYRVNGHDSYSSGAILAGIPQSPTQHQWATGIQVTSSENHPYHLIGKGDPRDIGGPFDTKNVHVDFSSDPLTLRHNRNAEGVWLREYTSIPVPSTGFRSLITGLPLQNSLIKANAYLQEREPHRPADSTLDAWGASVINSVKPTNPTVDLAMSIGEFVSEKKFFSLPGNAGSVPGEYLNYMFGVAPTIADVQDLRTAIKDKEKILRQHLRDSGRRIRRRYDAPEDISSSATSETGVHCAFLGAQPVTQMRLPGTLTTITRKSTKYAFSGAFTYYIPEDGMLRDIYLMDKLYGVVPGTALAWELMPFSWLVDYKLSIGAALSNIDSFAQDGLVMPYAYVMCHQQVHTEYTWTGPLRLNNGEFSSVSVIGTVTTETKTRRPANPFGFGIKPGDLSPKQVSILAALGLVMAKG